MVFGACREPPAAGFLALALGWLQYSQDYDERVIPYSSNGGSTGVACPWNYVIQPYLRSYAYNFILGGNGWSMAEFPLPAQTPAFADARGTNTAGQCVCFIIPTGALPYHDGRQLSTPGPVQTNTNGWSGNTSGLIQADRHLVGACYAFCDGHVKWMHYVTDAASCPSQPNSPPKVGLDFNANGVVGTGNMSVSGGWV